MKRRSQYEMPFSQNNTACRIALGIMGRYKHFDTPELREGGRQYARMMQHIADWLVTYRDSHNGLVLDSRSGTPENDWYALLDSIIKHRQPFFPSAQMKTLTTAHTNPTEEKEWQKLYYALDWLVEGKVKNWGHTVGKKAVPINQMPEGAGSEELLEEVAARDIHLWLQNKEREEATIREF
jgi:hypothetical protein